MAKDTEQDVVGLDLGDKKSHFCVLDHTGQIVESSWVATTAPGLRRAFERREASRIALEAGTHSAWIADLLTELGHEVLVANPRQIEVITKSNKKNDRNDAEMLARLARSDPKLLSPIKHRPEALRIDLAVIRARDALVQTRTKLINAARGLVKSSGGRLPKCSSASFHKKAATEAPDAMRPALEGLLQVIEHTTNAIDEHDARIAEVAQKYPEVGLLTAVPGVGTLTGLTFVLTVADRDRFKKSRDVGAYFGLVPRQQQSSLADPQLRITKAGDTYMRKLLVGSAHFVLGRFGPDTDLRRWGLRLAGRSSKNAKKRAVVAVARKLAVLLHRLWVTGEVYEPLRSERRTAAKDAVAAKSASSATETPSATATPSKESPTTASESSNDVSDEPHGELRGRPTRVRNPQRRPRKGGRVSDTLPVHEVPHTAPTTSCGELRGRPTRANGRTKDAPPAHRPLHTTS